MDRAAGGAAAAQAPDARRWIGLYAALTAPFLGVVDFYVVNLALPALRADLGASYAQQELAIALYGLSYAVFVVTGGRLGDTHGRRRVFLAGLCAFVATSVLCAASPSAWLFLASRLLQGLSAAIVFPQVLALITVTFPEHERMRALSYFGLTVGLASITGQLLGGYLLELDPFGLGWRALFLINLPIGAAAFLIARRTLREVRTDAPPTLDRAGVLAATAALALVLVPLTLGREAGWPGWARALLLAAPPALFLFLWLERRTARRGRDPLIDLRLLDLVGFRRGLAMVGCYFLGQGSVFFVLSLYLQDGLARDPFQAARAFLPSAVASLSASFLASRLAVHRSRLFLLGGIGCVIAGYATLVLALAFAAERARDVALVAGLAVYGFGNGSVSPVMYSAILSGVPARSAGSAAGVVATIQQVAAILGLAVIGLVFATALGSRSGPGDYAHATATALCINVASMLLAAYLATRLPRATPA